jgi:hypothetical protein
VHDSHQKQEDQRLQPINERQPQLGWVSTGAEMAIPKVMASITIATFFLGNGWVQ